MRIVRLEARKQDDATPVEADAWRVHDILWAHATRETELEHVRIRADQDRLSLIFLLADHVADPLDRVLALIGDATSRSAHLADWHFTPAVSDNPNSPGEEAAP